MPLTMAGVGVWALINGKVIPRWIFDREAKRADYWQATAERLLTLNHESQEVARQAGQLAREIARQIGSP
ncbi:MAG TPA: hypothetical protein VEO01_37960 [Pseudonocardiaceae bacterium]|nr:hypothetical protein [Pseudonocardiaceae bacterium]